MRRIVVVSERGKLVGTWIPPERPPDPDGATSEITAGKGQKLHQLAIEDAALLDREQGVALVKHVKRKLKLR